MPAAFHANAIFDCMCVCVVSEGGFGGSVVIVLRNWRRCSDLLKAELASAEAPLSTHVIIQVTLCQQHHHQHHHGISR